MFFWQTVSPLNASARIIARGVGAVFRRERLSGHQRCLSPPPPRRNISHRTTLICNIIQSVPNDVPVQMILTPWILRSSGTYRKRVSRSCLTSDTNTVEKLMERISVEPSSYLVTWHVNHGLQGLITIGEWVSILISVPPSAFTV